LLSNGDDAEEDVHYERNEDVCRNEIKPIPGNGQILAEFSCPEKYDSSSKSMFQ